MKKLLCVTVGLFICALSAPSANTGTLTQTAGAGGLVVVPVTAGGVPGATSINFNPSSNVFVGGVSDSTNFTVAAYHQQAANKTNGQRYGMGSDSNAMWFQDISAVASPAAITNTRTATAFSGWTSM